MVGSEADDAQRKAEWRALADPWIAEMREGRNANRLGLLDPAMRAYCGRVEGLRVLDSGCGEGRWCRIMSAAGAAEVLGLDLCDAMIAAARELQGPRETYRVADVCDLSFIADGSFDLAVSYLNQCDLADFGSNTREIYRVLRPGGRLVVANLHPMRSACGSWQRGDDQQKLHVVLDRYFDEGPRTWHMLGVEFTNFHRSLDTYADTYQRSGFVVERIVEPKPEPDDIDRFPELAEELRVPNFMVWVLRKP